MNWKQKLEAFFCSKSCEAHDTVEQLNADAMQLAIEGDLLMAGEKIRLSAVIIDDELESRNRAEEVQQEAELGLSYLDSLMVRNPL